MKKLSFSENTSEVVVLSGLEILLENARLRVQDDTASREDSDTSDSDSCTDYDIGFEVDSIKLISVQRVNRHSYDEEEEGREFEYGLDDSDSLCTESSILGQCRVALERRNEDVSISTKKKMQTKIPNAVITPPAFLFKSEALLDGKDAVLQQKTILHPATTCRLKLIHNSAA